MAPKAPRYDRAATVDKIAQALSLGCSCSEIASHLEIARDIVYKSAKGLRGLKPRLLAKLDDLIASRGGSAVRSQRPQLEFDFETPIVVPTPGDSLLELRVLKVRNEEVWMVEVRPKNSTTSSRK